MNNSFFLIDKVNNIQKEATSILAFSYNNDKFLIYYLDEDNNKKQIFVSKIVVNSEDKLFISDIDMSDKNKINNIVYNAVIVLPAETNKNNIDLINDFENKFNVKIISDSFNIENQNYLHNSRVAITSDILVNNCINFYQNYLSINHSDDTNIKVDVNSEQVIDNVSLSTLPVSESINNDNSLFNLNSNFLQSNVNTINDPVVAVNPQMQILEDKVSEVPIQTAINSDTNIDNLNNTSNENNNSNENNIKSEGFVINTSIIIGTVALLLSVVIVTVTFIVIKKMII